MKIGLIGLGKMGLNLALNAKEHAFDVVGFDVSTESVAKAHEAGLTVNHSIDELIGNLDDVRVVMLSLPAGKITNGVVNELSNLLKAGDIVGLLYNAFIKQYKNPENPETLKSLNVLCVRLVFCLYA